MSNVIEFANNTIEPLEAVIESGETVSNAVNVYGATFAAIEFPAAMTSTSITLQGSIDKGTTFNDIYTPIGGIATYTIGTSRVLVIDPTVTYPFDQIKIVGGSAEGAERTLKIKAFSI